MILKKQKIWKPCMYIHLIDQSVCKGEVLLTLKTCFHLFITGKNSGVSRSISRVSNSFVGSLKWKRNWGQVAESQWSVQQQFRIWACLRQSCQVNRHYLNSARTEKNSNLQLLTTHERSSVSLQHAKKESIDEFLNTTQSTTQATYKREKHQDLRTNTFLFSSCSNWQKYGQFGKSQDVLFQEFCEFNVELAINETSFCFLCAFMNLRQTLDEPLMIL